MSEPVKVDQSSTMGPLWFTEDETKAIKLSADLWNAFIELPRQHPSDTADFLVAIHAIQRILGYRPMSRNGYLQF